MNSEDKFIVRAKKNYGETTVVSCRMPNEVLNNSIKYLLVLEELEMS